MKKLAEIKKKIKKTWIGRYMISELHCVECRVLPALVSDEKAVRSFYRRNSGKELDLENPQTFEEKLNWYKLSVHDPLMRQCADKCAVRDYIIQKGYKDTLNKQLAVYDRVSEIDPAKLPEKFVLKASHGSHMNLIVKEKTAVNWTKEKLLMNSWLHQDIYWSGREWVYKDMPKKLIAEEYLEDETGELKDYKFFCFNGKPYYMQYDGNRMTDHPYRNFYDMNMQVMDIMDTVPNNFELPLPITEEVFEKMKLMAEDLAEPFQFVRVDLYVVNSKIYFGELTFYDAGGMCNLEPKKWNGIWGSHWIIDNRSEKKPD